MRSAQTTHVSAWPCTHLGHPDPSQAQSLAGSAYKPRETVHRVNHPSIIEAPAREQPDKSGAQHTVLQEGVEVRGTLGMLLPDTRVRPPTCELSKHG